MSFLNHCEANGPWGEVFPQVLALMLPWVLLTAPAAGQSITPRGGIVEELRLSAVSEDFPEVNRVNVGPAGQIAVALASDRQLRIYDARGKRLANVGRQGGGPGEFMSIGPFGWMRDTIWVADPGQFRTTFVSPAYRVLRTERFPSGRITGVALGGEVETVAPTAILEDGSLLAHVRWVPRDDRGVAGEPQQAFGVRNSNGVIRLTLRIPAGRTAPWSIAIVACCTFNVPFVPRPLYAVSGDGKLLAELTVPLPTQREGEYRVTVLRATGDTVFSKFYPYRGEPISQRSRDSALAVVGPVPGHLINVPTDLPERVREEARSRMPSWWAPLETILVGLDGSIWVGHRAVGETRSYLILNSHGEIIGELLVPHSLRVRQATASRIWVTSTDADGLSDVVRYRVVGLPQSAARP